MSKKKYTERAIEKNILGQKWHLTVRDGVTCECQVVGISESGRAYHVLAGKVLYLSELCEHGMRVIKDIGRMSPESEKLMKGAA